MFCEKKASFIIYIKQYLLFIKTAKLKYQFLNKKTYTLFHIFSFLRLLIDASMFLASKDNVEDKLDELLVLREFISSFKVFLLDERC